MSNSSICFECADINSIRYWLRDNSEVSAFGDKFIIVTPEERQSYRDYACNYVKEQRLAKKKEIEQRKIQDRARRQAEIAQLKKEIRNDIVEFKGEINAIRKAIKKEAIKKRIKSQFFGR